MDIEIIRERVRVGYYFIKSHAVQHALKEGFERQHMVEAVLTGTVIEESRRPTSPYLWKDNTVGERGYLLTRRL